jgi:hypothetical protein
MDHNVLHWMCPPQLLTLDERISNVLIILQDLSISPIDLLLVTLGPQNEYKAYKDSFYHGNSLAVDHLLNVVNAEKRGHDKLMQWVNIRALDVVLKRVSKEMDALRAFQMSIKDITPEFLMEFKLQTEITDVLGQISPWLRRILLTAAQTRRASIENKTKKVEHVSFFRYSRIINISNFFQTCSVIHSQLRNNCERNLTCIQHCHRQCHRECFACPTACRAHQIATHPESYSTFELKWPGCLNATRSGVGL